jgi:flagellar motor switch protein FliN/FliY
VNTEGALLHLAEATSEAVRGVLSTLAPEAVIQRDTRVDGDVSVSLQGLEVPTVAAAIAFVDGVEGGNLLVMPVVAARRLAAAMMGMDPAEVADDEPISELELSAAGEAMNQMMSAAAAATGTVLGQEVEIAPPDTRVAESVADLEAAIPVAGQATSADFTLFGFECRLVQLIPPAFLVLLEEALGVLPEGEARRDPLREAMLDVHVRVWAELGRTRMSSQRAVDLPPGAVVELDREADDAIDLYVDGLHFATGRLVVTDEGELAVRLETVGVAGSQNQNTLIQEVA